MEPEKKSSGALVGLIIIIIILVIGGIYMWQLNENAKKEIQFQNNTVTNEDSAELDTLDAELQTTDTNTGVDVNAVN
ncbi:hypothetical protein A3C60_00070 [Candidatus Nomurabacteria bacterium RIFCSPHIGHO2_02_FULL_37_45]|uniref:Uncharacterized protein n=2 Tax=Candidatus Nomuraibacteriota TaxID=1752729 RepID=A0A1F6Y2R2_9BACT|nr:MAG: hypothetical protein A2727_02580 [Candidatus Nomurabacteria bacterium RIFCSPHIGHO2_01_FULL_37_110]OGI70849.1 MAG: hypothetical protein A3C60_00070 [Candidatus Nomurabacteria bacterium RIFCSPHIGHO2_02_FULL_37_45]OGI78980.1 MAG: hypothetical protein A3F19_03085 [Candidatus Nomurabacteria bacterium RIFCSPHIGHO2_12_FULL_37_29]OGI84572.1 MAG: hypothetical protein A3A92_02660 [Candidatus Nomurabacteria bacterium RIFCSPLOWO2_01_FULL_37_49]OGJ00650.1 MAG: hypothetical protein A3G98_00205 [Candi